VIFMCGRIAYVSSTILPTAKHGLKMPSNGLWPALRLASKWCDDALSAIESKPTKTLFKKLGLKTPLGSRCNRGARRCNRYVGLGRPTLCLHVSDQPSQG